MGCLGAAGVSLALLASCTSPPIAPQEAAAVAADEARSLALRKAAMAQLLEEAHSAPEADRAEAVAAAREQLKRVAWKRSERPAVRLAAIELLAEDDEADTARMLSLMLPTETSWPVIEGVSGMAAARLWVSMTPALVRSWARWVAEPADEDRPERAALAQLHPGRPVEEVVFDVFLHPEGPRPERLRADAWGLLSRLDDSGAWTARRVAQLSPEEAARDPLLEAIRSAGVDLAAVPRTSEQLERLTRMRRDAERWRQAAQAIAQLRPEQRAGLTLAHAPIVLWASEHAPSLLSQSRSALLQSAASELARFRHVRRTAGYPDAMAAPRETIEEAQPLLSWGDALAVHAALRALDDQALVDELAQQMEADRRDSSTEYGGLIDYDASARRFVARLYPPRPSQRFGDNRFVASGELLEAAAWSPFLYHFHASSVQHGEFAGPGSGDLDFAKRHSCACLVFTSVAVGAFDADYHQGAGAVVDLGVRRRSDR